MRTARSLTMVCKKEKKSKKKCKKFQKNAKKFFGGLHQAPLEQALPGANTPPLEQTPPGAGTLLSRPPGAGSLEQAPPPCSWYTLMKILPCPKLHLRAVTRMHSSRMWAACSLTVSCSIQSGGSANPLDAGHLDVDPLGWNPQMRTSLEADTSSRCRQTPLDAEPPLWTEWHTSVKTWPCPKLRLRVVIINVFVYK